MIDFGVETKRISIEDGLSTVPANVSQCQFTHRTERFTVVSVRVGLLRIDQIPAASATAEALLVIRSIAIADCRSVVRMERSVAFLTERNRTVVNGLEGTGCVGNLCSVAHLAWTQIDRQLCREGFFYRNGGACGIARLRRVRLGASSNECRLMRWRLGGS